MHSISKHTCVKTGPGRGSRVGAHEHLSLAHGAASSSFTQQKIIFFSYQTVMRYFKMTLREKLKTCDQDHKILIQREDEGGYCKIFIGDGGERLYVHPAPLLLDEHLVLLIVTSSLYRVYSLHLIWSLSKFWSHAFQNFTSLCLSQWCGGYFELFIRMSNSERRIETQILSFSTFRLFFFF